MPTVIARVSSVLRWTERPEVAALVLANVVMALAGIGSLLAPFSPTSPRGLTAAGVVVCLTTAGMLLGFADRLRPGHLHAAVGVGTVLFTGFVASTTTPAGTVVTALGYFWIAVYCALFVGRHALVVHLVVIGAGMALALAAAGAVAPVHTWVLMMTTVVGVSTVLESMVGALRRLATRDPLTRVLNRRAFVDEARRGIARAARTGTPISVAMIDFDGFKAINDSLGHAAGDQVLISSTEAWRGMLRADDQLGRLGGDEFLVLLPGSDLESAHQVVARLRAVSTHPWTAGLAQWDGDEVDGWLRRADVALYGAKDRAPAPGKVRSRPRPR
ncbi:GGDEF domain-containing protein [Actinotalea sp.]|uniref:GGDEF domain-containing protein n=1 Tax=Actinotalea sp. TaxID=1872145 RepID=UPI00356A20DC